MPGAGDIVLVRPGHRVTYDVRSETVIRAVHVGGVLSFSRETDTLLCAGLIRIAAGEDCKEDGFDCHAPLTDAQARERPALEIGTAETPLPPERKAVIRLTYIDGMDKLSFPALVCCGGRLDLHGAPLERTWQKLGYQTPILEHRVIPVPVVPAGWRVGDRVLFTGTGAPMPGNEGFLGAEREKYDNAPMRDITRSEVRTIVKFGAWSDAWDSKDFDLLGLDAPLKYAHEVLEHHQAEMADLSRNVVVESADPGGVRGHTMYHGHSAGSLSYVEFRHLGKRGVLGRYPIHFHLTGDTMRGSSVVGCSIWDSANRAVAMHGTQYLVLRDNVAYDIVGHAYFLEDGTETRNVLDRNLACLVHEGEPLPDRTLPFDLNLGSGFWWANNLNTFTRNVAVECDQDGFKFEAVRTKWGEPRTAVRQPDGSVRETDLRTTPFIRFEDNEAHRIRFFCLNLGGILATTDASEANVKAIGAAVDAEAVGTDAKHPLIVKNFRAWDTLWIYNGGLPNTIIDGLDGFRAAYGLWRCLVNGQEVRRTRFEQVEVTSFYPKWNPKLDPQSQLDIEVAAVDDLPPSSIITEVTRLSDGRWLVKGVATDNFRVQAVRINGQPARSTRADFAGWEIDIAAPADGRITARAEDAAGNVELDPHVLALPTARPPVGKAQSTDNG